MLFLNPVFEPWIVQRRSLFRSYFESPIFLRFVSIEDVRTHIVIPPVSYDVLPSQDPLVVSFSLIYVVIFKIHLISHVTYKTVTCVSASLRCLFPKADQR